MRADGQDADPAPSPEEPVTPSPFEPVELDPTIDKEKTKKIYMIAGITVGVILLIILASLAMS